MGCPTRFVLGFSESGKFYSSNTLQHFDVLGICILNYHTRQRGVRVCVHIGVGFGVACSELKAIPEPREAEQQQCRSRFFVIIYLTNHFDMKPSNTNPSYFATYTLQNK